MINLIEIINNFILKNGWKIFCSVLDMTKEEFTLSRMSFFGASDSSKLLEVNPFYDDPILDLINEKVTNSFDETIGNKASVRMGVDLEEFILEKTQSILSNYYNTLLYVEKPIHTFIDKETHLGVNFDGVLYIPSKNTAGEIVDTLEQNEFITIIEAKVCLTAGRYYNFKKSLISTKFGNTKEIMCNPDFEKPDFTHIEDIKDRCHAYAEFYGIPVYYFTQLQQQLIPLKAPYGYLSVLKVNEWEFYVFKIYAHEDIQEELKQRGKINWAVVETKKELSNNE